MQLNTIHTGDALEVAKTLPDQSVNCIVTSPPYYGLRDYGVAGQMGLEETPEAYIEKMMLLFRECRRVLTDDGTCWVNIGDSYAAAPKKRTTEQACRKSGLNGGIASQIACKDQPNKITGDLKPKDLIGIPWMLAFALRADGWYLRQDIIWNKSNPMPESITDRCTKSHEYIFMLTKSSRYYYDAYSIRTPLKEKTFTTFGCEVKGQGDGSGLIASENWAKSINVRKPKQWKTPDGWDTGKGSHGSFHKEGRGKGKVSDKQRGHSIRHAGFNDRWDLMTTAEQMSLGANKRSVWTVATHPFSEAHFATFPPDLIIDCIKAGCPENGIVLDPFMGAGTTAMVAAKLNRNFIGIELNPAYVKIAEQRLEKELGMFNPTIKNT